jgi:hypothetical protein
MTLVTVKFSARELELLTTLASDQLFRREFCDSRLPGAQSNAAELDFGKRLVERLRIKTGQARGTVAPGKRGASILMPQPQSLQPRAGKKSGRTHIAF